MQSHTSEWKIVEKMMDDYVPFNFSNKFSQLLLCHPEKFVSELTEFKFISKLVGKNQSVLHFNCEEGIGNFILQSECGLAVGIEKRDSYLKIAQQNALNEKFYSCFSEVSQDLTLPKKFDAIVWSGKQDEVVLSRENIHEIKNYLQENGLFFLRTSEKRSYAFLQEEFKHVFSFSVVREVIMTGILNGSDSFLFVGSY